MVPTPPCSVAAAKPPLWQFPGPCGTLGGGRFHGPCRAWKGQLLFSPEGLGRPADYFRVPCSRCSPRGIVGGGPRSGQHWFVLDSPRGAGPGPMSPENHQRAARGGPQRTRPQPAFDPGWGLRGVLTGSTTITEHPNPARGALGYRPSPLRWLSPAWPRPPSLCSGLGGATARHGCSGPPGLLVNGGPSALRPALALGFSHILMLRPHASRPLKTVFGCLAAWADWL